MSAGRVKIFKALLPCLIFMMFGTAMGCEIVNANNSYVSGREQLTITTDPQNVTDVWLEFDTGENHTLFECVGKSRCNIPFFSFEYFNSSLECDKYDKMRLRVHCTNLSGATSVTEWYYFVKDTEPPEKPVLSYPVNTKVHSPALVFNWSVSERECSGVKWFNFILRNMNTSEVFERQVFYDEWLYCHKRLYVNSSAILCGINRELEEGYYNWTVFVADNTARTFWQANKNYDYAQFILDMSGPSIDFLTPENGTMIYSPTVFFNISTDGAQSCKINGNEMQKSGNYFTYTGEFQEGLNHVQVECADPFNFTSSNTLWFYRDTTPPTKRIVSVNGDETPPFQIKTSPLSVVVRLNENGTCRISSRDVSYNEMALDVECYRNDKSGEVVCAIPVSAGNNQKRYIACSDGVNNDTISTNLAVSFDADIKYGIGILTQNAVSVDAGSTGQVLLYIWNSGDADLYDISIKASGDMPPQWYELSSSYISDIPVGSEMRKIALNITVPEKDYEIFKHSYTLNVEAESSNTKASSSIKVNVNPPKEPEENTEELTQGGSQKETGTTEGSKTTGAGESGLVEDKTPPHIIEAYPSGISPKRNLEVWVVTDEKASCRLGNNNRDYESLNRAMSTEDSINHTLKLTSLTEGSHPYYVRCRDKKGNSMTTSYIINITVDFTPPFSEVKELPEFINTETFKVEWSGKEMTTSIKHYDIEVNKDMEGWETWLKGTTNTTAVFKGEKGHTYSFRSLAEDLAGNKEEKLDISGDTTTTVVGEKSAGTGGEKESVMSGEGSGEGTKGTGKGITGLSIKLPALSIPSLSPTTLSLIVASVILIVMFSALRMKPDSRVRSKVLRRFKQIKESL